MISSWMPGKELILPHSYQTDSVALVVCPVRFANKVGLVFNMDAYACQWRVIERPEGIKVLSIDFCGTITPHQVIFKENTYFGDNSCTVRILGSSNLDCSDQIFFSVRTQRSDWQLRTGQNNRLTQIFRA